MIFAASLELFELSHPVYDELEALYVMEGKASPMGAKPWTQADVRRLLDGITPSYDGSKELWNHINGYIKESDGFIFNAVLDPQFFYHTNEDFKGAKYIVSSDELDKQVAVLGFGYKYKDNVALYMDLSVGVTPSDVHTVSQTTLLPADYTNNRLNSKWGTNIPYLKDPLNIMNFPNNAYLAVGTSAFRLVSGRGQVEWGNGVLGNMVIGNTLPYHDYISLTFNGSNKFTYQLLSSFFSHSVNKLNNGNNDRMPLNGLRFFLGHRFEFSLFNGKLLLALNDTIMYQSKDNYVDLRVLNPLFFLHNGYMAGNSNSLASLEIEFSPTQFVSIYAQFGLDDYAVMGEPRPNEAHSSADGLGLMLGFRYRKPLTRTFLFHGNGELVYTTPYMYHRAMEYENTFTRELYFVSSTRYMTGSQSFLERYLSFPFGSDAIAASFSAGIEKIGLFDISANLFLMAHGVIDEYSSIRQYTGSEAITMTPSTSNPLGTEEDKDKGGVQEYTLAAGLDLTFYIQSWLPLNIGVDFVSVWNKGNYKAPVAYDIQVNAGLTIKY